MTVTFNYNYKTPYDTCQALFLGYQKNSFKFQKRTTLQENKQFKKFTPDYFEHELSWQKPKKFLLLTLFIINADKEGNMKTSANEFCQKYPTLLKRSSFFRNLQWLKENGFINYTSAATGTIITISHYEKYQSRTSNFVMVKCGPYRKLIRNSDLSTSKNCKKVIGNLKELLLNNHQNGTQNGTPLYISLLDKKSNNIDTLFFSSKKNLKQSETVTNCHQLPPITADSTIRKSRIVRASAKIAHTEQETIRIQKLCGISDVQAPFGFIKAFKTIQQEKNIKKLTRFCKFCKEERKRASLKLQKDDILNVLKSFKSEILLDNFNKFFIKEEVLFIKTMAQSDAITKRIQDYRDRMPKDSNDNLTEFELDAKNRKLTELTQDLQTFFKVQIPSAYYDTFHIQNVKIVNYLTKEEKFVFRLPSTLSIESQLIVLDQTLGRLLTNYRERKLKNGDYKNYKFILDI